MCYVTHCQYPSTAVTEVLEIENPLHLVQNSKISLLLHVVVY